MAISGTKGTKAIATRYPPTSGLTAETTKQKGRKSNLIATLKSNVAHREREGL